MPHVVTAPLVITKKQDGSDLYLYENSVVPDFVSPAEITRLTAIGMIDKLPDGLKPAKKPTSDSN